MLWFLLNFIPINHWTANMRWSSALCASLLINLKAYAHTAIAFDLCNKTLFTLTLLSLSKSLVWVTQWNECSCIIPTWNWCGEKRRFQQKSQDVINPHRKAIHTIINKLIQRSLQRGGMLKLKCPLFAKEKLDEISVILEYYCWKFLRHLPCVTRIFEFQIWNM